MSKQNHILIVDDDEGIRTLLADFLSERDFTVTTAANGDEMFQALQEHNINLVILDVLLPGDDGLTLCRKIRAISQIPIIMATAMDEETDRIVGLELGADDYMHKPFNPRELLARIKAIMRRTTGGHNGANNPMDDVVRDWQQRITFAGWLLDMGKRILLSPDQVEVAVSSGEYDLLVALLENAQRVLSRDQLLDITRNRPAGPFDRSIDVQISRLRQKIEVDPKNPQIIKTIRGGGYMLATEVKKNNEMASNL